MNGQGSDAGPQALPRAITLDLDDTLWPVVPTLVAAERALADWLGRHAPRSLDHFDAGARQRWRTAILAEHPGRSHDMSFLREEMIRRALLAAGEDVDLAGPAFAAFLAARQKVQLFEDVHAVLGRWARRYPLLALTNGNADIARIGLGDYFVGAVTAEDAGCAKPDPRIFAAACRRLDLAPEQILHVGDDVELDGRGARAAGLHAAVVRHPSLAPSPGPRAARREPAIPADALGLPTFTSLTALDHWLHGSAA